MWSAMLPTIGHDIDYKSMHLHTRATMIATYLYARVIYTHTHNPEGRLALQQYLFITVYFVILPWYSTQGIFTQQYGVHHCLSFLLYSCTLSISNTIL